MDDEKELAKHIGERFIALAKEFGIEKEYTAQAVAAAIYGWSHLYEPLNLEVLLGFKPADFSHDVAAIMRGDEFFSARSAKVYHPRSTSQW